MSDEEFDAIIGDAKWQLAHAQACLHLFEKDLGRRAAATAEVREWACAQDREHLQFRMKRYLVASELWAAACKRIWKNIPAPMISRPPIGQRICCTLAETAKTTGLNESTILIAIKDGRIAGMKDMFGQWHIERAELHGVFSPLRPAATMSRDDRALNAAALVLEVEIAALIREAGDTLRRGRPWWRCLVG